MMIDIIIISYNSLQFAIDCIQSIKDTVKSTEYQITLVDNASTDSTLEIIPKKFPDVTIVADKSNRGYSAAVNLGMKATNNSLAIICNADIVFVQDTADRLVEFSNQINNWAVIGCQQIFPNGKWQLSYSDLPGYKLGLKFITGYKILENLVSKSEFRLFKHQMKTKKVGFIDGAFIMTNREAFNSIGGFDENYFLYFEESDFCKRAKDKSLDSVFYPKASVIHYRGGSSSKIGDTSSSVTHYVNSCNYYLSKHCSYKEHLFYLKSMIVFFVATKFLFIALDLLTIKLWSSKFSKMISRSSNMSRGFHNSKRELTREKL